MGALGCLFNWFASPEAFSEEMLAAHFAKADLIAHVRAENGLMVGYLCAWSNGMGEAWITASLAHPEYDQEAIFRLMVNAALERFAGQPVYAMPFADEQAAFRAEGFKVSGRQMIALANGNGVAVANAG